jgi:hypothetical protein
MLTERDAALLALIQRARLDGEEQIEQTGPVLATLTVGEHADMVAPQRVELGLEPHAASTEAQLSFPPRRAHNENVVRVPRLLPTSSPCPNTPTRRWSGWTTWQLRPTPSICTWCSARPDGAWYRGCCARWTSTSGLRRWPGSWLRWPMRAAGCMAV